MKAHTVEELAAMLRCSAETVRRRIRKGEIKAGRRGRGRNPYLISDEEAQRLLAEATGQDKKEPA